MAARASRLTSSFGRNLLDRTELQRLYTGADLCDIAHDYNGQLVRLHILPGDPLHIRGGHSHDPGDVRPVVLQWKPKHEQLAELSCQITGRLELPRELQHDEVFGSSKLARAHRTVPDPPELAKELDE